MAGRQVLSKLKYFKEQAFINGTWCASSSKQTFPVYSPSTREVHAVFVTQFSINLKINFK